MTPGAKFKFGGGQNLDRCHHLPNIKALSLVPLDKKIFKHCYYMYIVKISDPRAMI
jgi:hypothetical protein